MRPICADKICHSAEILSIGEIIEVLEVKISDRTGAVRVRCSRGWATLRTACGRTFLVKADLARQQNDHKGDVMVANAEAEDRAAMQVQRLHRGKVARARVSAESNAVLGIQAAFRGKQARQEVAKLLEFAQEEEKAAIRLQSVARGNQMRARVGAESNAALGIQAAFRGKQARQEAAKLLEFAQEEEKAA
eukprot:SAG11_NODE_9438_length_911_cov_1.482759_2_plen_190_part_01